LEAARDGARGGAAPAALLGEEVKLKAAPALRLVGAECYPLAMSANGRMTPRFLAFVKELASRLSRKRDCGVADEHKWLLQRISVAVHGGNGRMLAAFGDVMDHQ
jgi:D-serine deaminase-like pyridoxal phosphate-dependent protein